VDLEGLQLAVEGDAVEIHATQHVTTCGVIVRSRRRTPAASSDAEEEMADLAAFRRRSLAASSPCRRGLGITPASRPPRRHRRRSSHWRQRQRARQLRRSATRGNSALRPNRRADASCRSKGGRPTRPSTTRRTHRAPLVLQGRPRRGCSSPPPFVTRGRVNIGDEQAAASAHSSRPDDDARWLSRSLLAFDAIHVGELRSAQFAPHIGRKVWARLDTPKGWGLPRDRLTLLVPVRLAQRGCLDAEEVPAGVQA
jgi:hypothetical protein